MTDVINQVVFYAWVDGDGKVGPSGMCPPSALADMQEHPMEPDIGKKVYQTPSLYRYDEWWHDGVEFKQKEPITATWDKTKIVADGVDYATLSPLPIPCKVAVDGVEHLVTDGSFEFAASTPGDYHITVDQLEYQYTQWFIDAD